MHYEGLTFLYGCPISIIYPTEEITSHNSEHNSYLPTFARSAPHLPAASWSSRGLHVAAYVGHDFGDFPGSACNSFSHSGSHPSEAHEALYRQTIGDLAGGPRSVTVL
jgi:hypothetical protein